MSRLLIYTDRGDILLDTENPVRISNELALVGIGFRRWATQTSTASSAAEILSTYTEDIEQVMQTHKFSSVDVISLDSSIGSERISAAREKFLSEHIHSDDEVRFFIDGEGLFCLHIEDKVLQILCSKGDFINVPANTKHWFDMGSRPNFKCIRFFSDEAGWVANYSGDNIARQFPLLDELQIIHA